MPTIHKIHIGGRNIEIRTGSYEDGDRLALLAYSIPEGEIYAELSVNLPDYFLCDDQCFFARSDAFSLEVLDHLEQADIITQTSIVVPYGDFDSRAIQYRLNA